MPLVHPLSPAMSRAPRFVVRRSLDEDRAVTVPVALSIAGSDPSGSSGIQADLPTFAALGVHGTSVITVLTAQDSTGVSGFHQLPAELVAAQLGPLVSDLPPAATKTGLLRDASVVRLVSDRAATGSLGALVVDPVLVDSRGQPIADDAAVAAYRDLAGAAAVLTPNRWEAELLTGCRFTDDDHGAAVDALHALGSELVVVTGGRGEGPTVTDWLLSGGSCWALRAPRVGRGPIRGTGCTFSAALAAHLARGATPVQAAERASEFVRYQLMSRADLRLGAGRPGVPHALGAVGRPRAICD